eukprot:gene40417-49988_t
MSNPVKFQPADPIAYDEMMTSAPQSTNDNSVSYQDFPVDINVASVGSAPVRAYNEDGAKQYLSNLNWPPGFSRLRMEHSHLGTYIISVGFAANSSDAQTCNPVVTASMAELERVLSINVDLNVGGYYCTNPPCTDNPCPGILAPQLMGYDTKYASSSILTWKLDMASVVTALAVNMGILPLTTLTNIKGDNDRINLLNNMAAQGFIDQQTVYNTSSYF